MATTSVPVFTPRDPALAQAVTAALEKFPQDEGRILRAAEIVERDYVRPPTAPQSTWLIGVSGWPVTCTCECPDYVNRRKACKHLYSKWLYLKMRQAPQSVVRTLYFYADLHGIAGTAQVWEDGRIVFQAYDDETPIACTMDEIVLAGRKDLVDAAWGTV